MLLLGHIARSAGLHYNHRVGPSVCPFVRKQLVKCSSLLNHMVYFDEILHTRATGMKKVDEDAWRILNVESCRKSQNLC